MNEGVDEVSAEQGAHDQADDGLRHSVLLEFGAQQRVAGYNREKRDSDAEVEKIEHRLGLVKSGPVFAAEARKRSISECGLRHKDRVKEAARVFMLSLWTPAACGMARLRRSS
jgi:hypothetical protein